MPVELANHLSQLEKWYNQNKSDARKDLIAYWILKVPAIFAAASAGVWAHFGLTTVSVISGAVASFCVIVDGVNPRGILRNVHLRASHDISILSSRMIATWRSRSPSAKDESVTRSIISDFEAERIRIANYIRDAETALRPTIDM